MIRVLLLIFCFLGTANAANPDDLLEPEKAFRMSARALDANTVEVSFAIAEGYYMYRERFRFAVDPGANGKLGAPQFPAGTRKKDEFFGEVETYRKQVVIRVPVMELAGTTLRLTVTSQGCADVGVCYVPMDSKATLQLAAFSMPPKARTIAGVGSAPELSTQSSDFEIAQLFNSGSPLLVLASFLGFGLLLTFTPCVLPMIPILSGIIAGEGKDLGKLRAFLLSLAYVLGMAVAYALAGVAAAWSGTMLAAALQNAWVLGAFALIFVVLALSMFGFYELQLPGFLRHPLSVASHRLPGGKLASVAGMGVLSAIIVSPCVAAPLAGALLYISQTRDVALGGAALFTMALGMGVPLLVVGVSEGALLPKSGPWMARVKQIFGVLLLAVALWIVWPVLRPSGGNTDFVRIASIAELEAKLKSPSKPVMLDFYADWCVSCKEMEALTFNDVRVKTKMEGMLLLQADVTANTEEHKALLKHFSLFGPPGIVFFDAQGREIKGLRVIGYQNAERFLRTLELANTP
ncbi:MAG: protein-disulfide reductase DsbD [Betaproteobacteria bacterium]|nr:protein-disulfide reductase DsbD [Betaproteobacteria bacterium]